MDRNRLNWIIAPTAAVALRKESVDRNCDAGFSAVGALKSLSARRAWIEIGGASQLIKSSIVALRKESVDRNPLTRRFIGGIDSRSPQGERG